MKKSHIPADPSPGSLVAFLLEKGLAGFGPMSSARHLADEYLLDQDYPGHDDRVDSLIKWETGKNFTSGFLTGLGGVVALPLSISSALGASWLLQARMAGAIAAIYGHELHAGRVRTMILLSLAGERAREAMEGMGIPFNGGLSEDLLQRIPGRALVEINKRIGVRLLTKAGQRSAVNLSKAVPLFGGVVGGTMDAAVCRLVGRTAKSLFRPVTEG
jgi:EcsC protein family